MDRRSREAKRAGGEGGGEKQAKHLVELMRSGEIERNKVEFAAFLGYEPAKMIIPEEEQFEVVSESENMDFNSESSRTLFHAKEMINGVRERFGNWAYIAISIEPLRFFLPSYKQFFQSSGEVQNEAVEEAIATFQHYLDVEEVDENQLSVLIQELRREINRLGAMVSSPGSGLGYAFIPVILAYDLSKLLSTESDDPVRDTYETLFVRFVRNQGQMNSNDLDLLPPELKKMILEIEENNRDKSIGEQAGIADETIKRMMKESGLEWALKDVK